MKLFIDDERFPPNDGAEWVIARNMQEVQKIFALNQYPSFISFDHDLGESEPTGMDIARWICEYDMDNNVLPVAFVWYTHSQNPVGKQNIDGYLSQYISIKTIADTTHKQKVLKWKMKFISICCNLLVKECNYSN